VRCILIVGDGMADRPLKQLGMKTPLEAANPQNMNLLTCRGVSGLLDSVAPGVAPGSDAANLSILGYDPKLACCGRGPFEAAGAGIKLKTGDLAFRTNFVTVDSSMVMADERAGRIGQEAKALENVFADFKLRVNSDFEVVFKQTLGFKGTLLLRSNCVSSKVSAVLPETGEKVCSIKPLDNSSQAKKTADALNEFVKMAHEKLAKHPINIKRAEKGLPPANAIVPWSGGFAPKLQLFQEKYDLKAACVSAVSLIKGIGNLTGMDVLNVEGATGDLNTDTLAKSKSALGAIRNHDFVFVHVEGADEASHDGDVEGKIGIIRKIDAMVGDILNHVDLDNVCVALMADHATSCENRKHTGDSVPITFASTQVVVDGVKSFNEKAVSHGGLHRILGKNVMPILQNVIMKPQRIGG
jgi:2,3-bisphosphoglycerate-independent phosphoglycerate mutase